MPIYDYHCDHCGHAFSVVRSFKDDDVTVCPNCGKHPRRLLSKPAIVFKGSGWYINDSRSSASTSTDTGSKDGEKSEKTEKTEKKDTSKTTETTSTAEKSSTSSGG